MQYIPNGKQRMFPQRRINIANLTHPQQQTQSTSFPYTILSLFRIEREDSKYSDAISFEVSYGERLDYRC